MPKPQPSPRSTERQQMMLIGVVLGVVAILIGGVLILLNQAGGPQAGKYDQLYKTFTKDGFPIIGDPTTRLTLLELTDFACQNCLAYEPTISTLIDQYIRTGRARLIVAPQAMFQNSALGASAALCAAQQKKFLEMRDALVDLQSRDGAGNFSLERLKQTAATLNLNMTQWLDCVATNAPQSALTNAAQLYQNVKAQAIPALLWSDDGQSWKFFTNALAQPYSASAPPLSAVIAAIDSYYQKKS